MKVQLFLVSLVVNLVESTGDIVVSVKGFASFIIIVFLATEVVMYSGEGGGNRGSLPPASSMRGAPNSAELFQIRSGSSFISQSSFFKKLVSLYC